MDHRAVRSRAKGLIAALAALSLAVPAPVLAWGGYGHRTTAEIAEANVRPETRAAMNRLFAYEDRLGTPDCRMRDLPDASTWPDCIRRDGWRWGYTGAWHYRTAPICEPYNERANCPGGNCVTAQIERAQRHMGRAHALQVERGHCHRRPARLGARELADRARGRLCHRVRP